MVSIIKGEENGVLLINGQKFNGFIDGDVCPNCAELRIYSYDYDAYFCAVCNEWLESVCSDAAICEFCMKRPGKPSDAFTGAPLKRLNIKYNEKSRI